MTEQSSAEIRKDRLGILLGTLAREQGLITAEQLKDCLAEQARDLAAGKRKPRPLGVLLVARGYVSDQQLIALLEAQKVRCIELDAAKREDSLLGRLLIEAGAAAAEHVNECLRLQAEAVERGEASAPRLGELLVKKGYATAEAVGRVLARQRKTILLCPRCAKRYNVTGYAPSRAYVCKACKGELIPLPSVDNVRVDDSAVLPPLSSSGTSAAGRSAPPPPPKVAPRPRGSEGEAFAPFGKYTILREVGRGGMGVVYEALDTNLGRSVALKMMFLSPHADAKERGQEEERFLREAKLTAGLSKHPGIVGIYEAGVIEGSRYIAMEFVDGVSFAEWRRRGSISIRQQVTLLRDTLLAIHHAHEHGVIHRDLKPANILVDGRNRAYVTDFGLAKTAGQHAGISLTASGMVVGTPAYMSPEQAQGLKSIDRRTDVYAMGVMLYELLTGRPPFTGETAVEVLMKTVKNPVPPPSSVIKGKLPPTMDKAIEDICLKSLAKMPRDRYTTAEAFAGDLTKWLQGDPIRVTLPRTRPKSRAWASWLAAAVLIGGGIGLYLHFSSASAEGELSLARAFMRQKRYEQAAAAYARAAALDPADDEARRGKRDAEDRLRAAREAEKQAAADAAADQARREAEAKAHETEERLRREAEIARLAAEKARKEAEEKSKAVEERLKREAEAAKLAAERARTEGKAEARAEAETTLQAEREQLAAEKAAAEQARLEAEEKARAAGEAAKRAQDALKAAAVLPAAGRFPARSGISASALKPGVAVEIYRGVQFAGAPAYRGVLADIDFSRHDALPIPDELREEGFSVRFRGVLRIPQSGVHTLEVSHGDRASLLIDDRSLLNAESAHRSVETVACDLAQGFHTVLLEYAGRGEKVRGRVILRNTANRELAPSDIVFYEAGSASSAAGGGGAGARDLLRLIDPQRDAVKGVWTMDGGALVSQGDRYARIRIPVEPLPEEYALTIEVERRGPPECLAIGLLSAGRPFAVEVDTDAGHGTAIVELDGKSGRADEPGEIRYGKGPVLPANQTAVIVCSVRRNRFQLDVDGRSILDWKDADYRRVKSMDEWEVRGSRSLMLGTWTTPFRFTRITLTPLAASPASAKAAAGKDEGDSLVKNGDFEGTWGEAAARPNVAAGWSVFNKSANYGFEKGPGYMSPWSQGMYWNAAPWDCGVYQVVTGLKPGATYKLSMRVMYRDARKVENPDDADINAPYKFWIGFDPDGDTWRPRNGPKGWDFPPTLQWTMKDVMKHINDAGGPNTWLGVNQELREVKSDKLGLWVWASGFSTSHHKYIDKVSLKQVKD